MKHIGFGSSMASRLCWFCIVVFQFSVASVLTFQVWETWSQNPVVTVTELMPVAEVDFPAVTICPKGLKCNFPSQVKGILIP